MKLPKLIALHYGLAAILLGSAVTTYAETPKKEMVETQKMESEAAIDAAEMAKPEAEARPAVTTSQKKHSVEPHKGKMIKEQKKATEKAVRDAEAANSKVDVKPAATN